MRKFIQITAWLLVIIGACIVIYFIYIMSLSGYSPWEDKLDIAATGEFGDFVGGFVGTIISGAGFLFLYLTLKEQRESFAKERFENNFFELLKLHRDNVTELKYKKISNSESEVYEGREVFKIIFEEFLECLQEVRRYSKSTDINEYLIDSYKTELEEIKNRINRRINLIELITIDIAYCIVFFGVSDEGETFLRHRFLKRYNSFYFYRLLKYIKLKPKNDKDQQEKWQTLYNLNINKRKETIDEIYKYRNHVKSPDISELARSIMPDSAYEKYYVGHQFRLGHYFRHLFQSYKFLNESELHETEKYFYGKTFRAQLSTYEQALLFINSISSLGMKWEFTPEIDTKDKTQHDIQKEISTTGLITKYNLTKNLPGENMFGIRYRDYYPKVNYEMGNK